MAAHTSSAPPSIPGYQLSNEDCVGLKHTVAELVHREGNTRFPGAQPVSFARQHLAELQQREYFMCEKTDGLRCLLFLHYTDTERGFEPVTFLIDRKNNYYEVKPPIRVPYHGSPFQQEAFLYATILDGELVNDLYPDGTTKLIFYAFDCLAADSENFTDKPLSKRLWALKERVIKPWHTYLTQTKSLMPLEPFQVKEKEQQSSYHISYLFDQVMPKLKHGNDGLIFTYPHILKWKPPHENTIDFKLRLGEFPIIEPPLDDEDQSPYVDYDAMPTSFDLHVNHGSNKYRPFAHKLSVTLEEWEMLKGLKQRLDGRIIECFRDADGRWKFKKDDDGTPRWRDDKADANHVSTVESVLGSIEDPVTEQDLRTSEGAIKRAIKQMQAGGQYQEPDHANKKRRIDDVNGH
ncbi:Dcp1p-Dcp2p decapping enzyme complex alpha subunit [Didymosphaeria variabile]|uniref:mRNA guanylyltransferase n=1 Tax=Didymosphaeria variabile TaxID=1932322 RepID=A0A9W8XQR7_9PLEO|nr:Dcp1p-Dcp2p decapping enzyme complex alpha subunit [Didymosphaeria variabile]KAJ4355851.1 Dcp1p-Dcp2p decapping enzyme complex alpha subunit [Didymosphaeria variabile]